MAVIFVFKKKEEFIIRDPLTGVKITKDGCNVQSSSYWTERERAGLIGIGHDSHNEWIREQSSPAEEFDEEVDAHFRSGKKKRNKHN